MEVGWKAGSRRRTHAKTKVSKNLLVWARCHLTGLVSGEDCTIMSSGDKGLQRLWVVWRMVLNLARSELTAAVVATLGDMVFSL